MSACGTRLRQAILSIRSTPRTFITKRIIYIISPFRSLYKTIRVVRIEIFYIHQQYIRTLSLTFISPPQSPIDHFSNMSQSVPKTVKQWNVTGQDGFESLKLTEHDVPELDHNQVLVKSMSSHIPSASSVSSLTILQSRVLR